MSWHIGSYVKVKNETVLYIITESRQDNYFVSFFKQVLTKF